MPEDVGTTVKLPYRQIVRVMTDICSKLQPGATSTFQTVDNEKNWEKSTNAPPGTVAEIVEIADKVLPRFLFED